MKETPVQDTPLTPENLLQATMQKIADQGGPSDRAELATQAAIELATDLLRMRQEHTAMLQHAQENLERLHSLAHRRADLLHLTDRYLREREAFPGEKRLRRLVNTAEPEPPEPFHHN